MRASDLLVVLPARGTGRTPDLHLRGFDHSIGLRARFRGLVQRL